MLFHEADVTQLSSVFMWTLMPPTGDIKGCYTTKAISLSQEFLSQAPKGLGKSDKCFFTFPFRKNKPRYPQIFNCTKITLQQSLYYYFHNHVIFWGVNFKSPRSCWYISSHFLAVAGRGSTGPCILCQLTRVLIPALSLGNYVNLCESFSSSGPKIPHLCRLNYFLAPIQDICTLNLLLLVSSGGLNILSEVLTILIENTCTQGY